MSILSFSSSSKIMRSKYWYERAPLWKDPLIGGEPLLGPKFATITDERTLDQIAGFITTGFDANGDGRISEFEGECGLNQIPGFALEAARMNLIEGDIN